MDFIYIRGAVVSWRYIKDIQYCTHFTGHLFTRFIGVVIVCFWEANSNWFVISIFYLLSAIKALTGFLKPLILRYLYGRVFFSSFLGLILVRLKTSRHFDRIRSCVLGNTADNQYISLLDSLSNCRGDVSGTNKQLNSDKVYQQDSNASTSDLSKSEKVYEQPSRSLFRHVFLRLFYK